MVNSRRLVEVFYRTDKTGKKVQDESRLQEIPTRMTQELAEFEATKHKELLA